jgi:hypothetical protein
MKRWFQTWDRPEYKEWARKIPEGYFLLIIRKEKEKTLCVKAKLLMAEKGLPNFQIVEELRVTKNAEALKQMQAWKMSR